MMELSTFLEITSNGIYGLRSKTTVTPTGKKNTENDIKILIGICSGRKSLSSIPSKRII